jgi:O-antigen ligase
VLERIADQPLVGHGFVGWWPDWDPWFAIQSIDGLEMRQAHNLWLDLAMQTGIVGAMLFAITLGSILWTFGRAFVESPRATATVPFLITLALTVQSLTESRLIHEWGFVLLIVFVVCAKRQRADVSASS